MKKNFLLPIMLAFFVSQTLAQSKMEKQVSEVVENLRKAMLDGDRLALEAISDEKLSYGHSNGLVENKIGFVEKIATGKSDFVSINLSEQSISISGKTAIVRHILNATTNDGGVSGTVRLKVLLVFQQSKKGWLLLARQAVKIT